MNCDKSTYMNTVDAQEIQNFSKDSSHWWDLKGPFKPLHRLNPVRMKYIKDQICDHFEKDNQSLSPFKGLTVLDIGCGGGLVCEPMTRLGGKVTGIDADENAVLVAQDHAQHSKLDIHYQAISSEQLLETSKKYDVVLALEIIEHVSEPALFVKNALELCAPNGLIIFSTLNRTTKSFALGILAAEYILRWVPKGTHHWEKFIKPSELARHLRQQGKVPHDITGMIFHPIANEFRLSPQDTSVNYFMSVKNNSH